ncbi:MAG: bile acid:sodium symporter family protein [Verrucomicrobiales bacterium]
MIEVLTQATRLVVVVFLLSSMAGIGLGLTVPQVVGALKSPRFVLGALAANFLLSPLLAMGIARLLRLDEPFAIGLLVLGLTGGAPFLPKVVDLAKGDVASAVGLMVLLMLGTTVLVPVVLPLLVKGVHVEPLKIVLFLVLLMLCPLGAGMAVKAMAPRVAARCRPVLERISSVALLGLLILILGLNFQAVLRLFGTGSILAAVLFAALAALGGWLLGGPGNPQRTLLGLGTALRNIPAALIISVQNFRDPNVSVMVLVTTLTGILLLVPAAVRMGRRHAGSPA